MSLNTELFEGRELAAAGEVVTAITLDSDVVIYVGAARQHKFRIENDITVKKNDGDTFTVQYNPYDKSHPLREHLTELSEIVTTTVLHAKAYTNGVLELSFSDGARLTVRPKEKYEAWMYTFGNYIPACPPGGFETR